MNYELHPLCEIFPRLNGVDFEFLKIDIQKNGLRTPITIFDGQILDGGNRYAACLAAGIDPIFEEYSGGDPVAFVMSMNRHRRHLSPGQYATIVSLSQDWRMAQKTGSNQYSTKADGPATLPDHNLSTVAARAAQSGASDRTQRNADKVAKADTELAKQVVSGKTTLSKAIKTLEVKAGTRTEKGPQPSQPPPPADEPPEPEYTELDAAKDQIAGLQDMVAMAHLEGTEEEKALAGETIKALREEVKTLTATLVSVKAIRDGLQMENAELKSQCRMQAKEIKRLGGR